MRVGYMIRRKRKFTPEAQARVEAFNAKHGIDRVQRDDVAAFLHGIGAGAKSRCKHPPSLPKITFKEVP